MQLIDLAEPAERSAMLSTPPRLGGMKALPFRHARRRSSHGFIAIARGAQVVGEECHGFAWAHRDCWSLPGYYDHAMFERVAAAQAIPAGPR